MTPPPFHSRIHQLHVAIDGDTARMLHTWERWAAETRAWWHEERPPLGRHNPAFPKVTDTAMDEAA